MPSSLRIGFHGQWMSEVCLACSAFFEGGKTAAARIVLSLVRALRLTPADDQSMSERHAANRAKKAPAMGSCQSAG